mgnify:FL=1
METQRPFRRHIRSSYSVHTGPLRFVGHVLGGLIACDQSVKDMQVERGTVRPNLVQTRTKLHFTF